ncbi:MAG: hypothetical protein WC326_04450 [Candidatus Delongbacteria bacterium]
MKLKNNEYCQILCKLLICCILIVLEGKAQEQPKVTFIWVAAAGGMSFIPLGGTSVGFSVNMKTKQKYAAQLAYNKNENVAFFNESIITNTIHLGVGMEGDWFGKSIFFVGPAYVWGKRGAVDYYSEPLFFAPGLAVNLQWLINSAVGIDMVGNFNSEQILCGARLVLFVGKKRAAD